MHVWRMRIITTQQPTLREVYEFAAATISSNAVALVPETLLPEVAEAVGAQLLTAAVAVFTGVGGGSLPPDQLRATVEQGLEAVLPQVHAQAVTRAADIITGYCQPSAVRAMVGLCAPAWGDTVVLTAAAMVADAATAAALRTVLVQLPEQLQQTVSEQLKVAVMQALRHPGGAMRDTPG